jgi:putative oxidoreductase
MLATFSRFDTWLNPRRRRFGNDLGLLLLRLGIGLMMAFSHGYGKFSRWLAGGEIQFADPIGLGPGLSLALAGSAEFLGGLLLALGLMTRLATLPLAFTMAVAAFVVHAADPFQKQEFALLYLVPCLVLFFTGPGRFSLDEWLRKRLLGDSATS